MRSGGARRRPGGGERGQVATTYAGVLAVVALIFVALFSLGLDGRVSGAANDAVCAITGAGCPEAGASSDNAYLGPDTDHDGVPDVRERQLGTNPAAVDTDGDGVADGDDPVPGVRDFDGDGLDDGVEVALGSDPRNADSDQDGVPDGQEYRDGTDPAHGIKPMTPENRFKPWERLGITQDEWAQFEQEVLDEVNPGGWKGFLFGPSAAGVGLDEDGHIALIEIQENGIPVGPLLRGIVGGAKLTVEQAGARALSRLPASLASKFARVGVIATKVPRIKPPAPPAGPGTAFGELDALGRPTGAAATITKDMLGTGSDALRSIKPPGFLGGGANQARGHLIAKQLGGAGNDARNLVTLYQNPVNSPIMRGFENQVRAAVEAGERIRYTVTPIYRGTEAIPRAVTLSARGSNGFRLDVSVLNRAP
jgi:hypothetical protein